MADSEGKKLADLRVVDLRAELEKRGLDKTGIKAALMERLQKALISEGEDPEIYEFDFNDKRNLKRRSSTNNRSEDIDTSNDNIGNDPSILLIDTQCYDNETISDEQEENVKTSDKNDKQNEKSDGKLEIINVESPLNLSIGEDEELLNSGDEQEQSEDSKKKTNEDEKPAVNEDASTVTQEESHRDLEEEKDGVPDSSKQEYQESEDAEPEKNEAIQTSSAKQEESASNEEPSSSTVDAADTQIANASEKESSVADKEKSPKNNTNPGRCLWIINLLPSTRAQELKHLLSKYGKVIGAKVVQSSRYPRQKCYGYVIMETRAAANLCIEKLNNTELRGQIIRIAKVRPDQSLSMSKIQKKDTSPDKHKKSPEKVSPKADSKSGDEKKKSSEEIDKKKDDALKKDRDTERERSRHNSRDSSRRNRSLSKTSSRADRKTDILTFDKIREERERQRARERERAMREEEKRRREIQRSREIEKRQREEAIRLEREREKLRIERERLDRQRVEIMRMERERQRLEREKLEQEKQELRRQQMRLEEARRPVKRPSSTSTSSYRRDSGSYADDRKRLVTERHFEETPPPPRFDVPSRDTTSDIAKNKDLTKDYKSRMAYSKRAEEYPPKRNSGAEFKREYPSTERHSGGHPSHMVHSLSSNTSSSKYESPTYVNRDRERDIREAARRDTIVPNVPPPRISKDARYAERSGGSPITYRPVRDDRDRGRPVSEHHSKSDIRSSREHRYAEASMKDGTRYREGGNSWHSTGAPPVKPFSGLSNSATSSRESWNKSDSWRAMESSSNERWGNNSSRILMSGSSGVPNTMYSGGNSNLGLNTGLTCPPPPGNSSYSMDRFDTSFKSLNNSRKY